MMLIDFLKQTNKYYTKNKKKTIYKNMLLTVEWQYARLKAIQCETSVEFKQTTKLR